MADEFRRVLDGIKVQIENAANPPVILMEGATEADEAALTASTQLQTKMLHALFVQALTVLEARVEALERNALQCRCAIPGEPHETYCPLYYSSGGNQLHR